MNRPNGAPCQVSARWLALCLIAAAPMYGCGGDQDSSIEFLHLDDAGVPAVEDGGEVDDGGIDTPGCDAGTSYDGDSGTCVPDVPSGCGEGLHDDGTGACAPEGTCAPNHYPDADGSCVQLVAFVQVPAGEFIVPHDTATLRAGSSVDIQDFEMGVRPVSVAEFSRCVQVGACSPSGYVQGDGYNMCNMGDGSARSSKEAHPMNCVTPAAAAQFCQWIGGRLPTEEEWEYAATHDGSDHRDWSYPWGDKDPVHCVTASFMQVSPSVSYCDGVVEVSVLVGTSAIGTYSPEGDSMLGLVDICGNVAEITSSLYSAESGEGQNAVKGGTMDMPSYYFMKVQNRLPWNDANTYRYGFRCAR